jgi:D-alanyl-D-alanine endopeptidase (penicillin-binding protein 7)
MKLVVLFAAGLCVVSLAAPAFAQTAPVAKKPAVAATSTAVSKPAAKPTTVSRPPAAVSAMTFKRDSQGNLVPDVHAAAAIVYDPQTGRVIWEQNSREERSIASLTKLMTAVTFVASEPDLSQRVTVTRADLRNASVTYLMAGDVLSYDELLHLALIASDNGAARVLARLGSPGGTEAFVGRMNEMATTLGLANTHYSDPSGLDSRDVSCAYDLSRLISVAAADYRLGPIMRTAEYEVHTSSRAFAIHSTNHLLGTDVDVRGGKTGFIAKAGYCLATLLQMPQGSQFAVVVLGETTSISRFTEARHLFNWAVSRTQGIIGHEDR